MHNAQTTGTVNSRRACGKPYDQTLQQHTWSAFARLSGEGWGRGEGGGGGGANDAGAHSGKRLLLQTRAKLGSQKVGASSLLCGFLVQNSAPGFLCQNLASCHRRNTYVSVFHKLTSECRTLVVKRCISVS